MELEFLSNPDKWPRKPLCPVKSKTRYDSTGFPELGVICANGGPTVFLTDIFTFMEHGEAAVIEGTFKKREYKSLQELVNVGWVVD